MSKYVPGKYDRRIPNQDAEGNRFRADSEIYSPKPLILYIPHANARLYFTILEALEREGLVPALEEVVSPPKWFFTRAIACRIVSFPPKRGLSHVPLAGILEALDERRSEHLDGEIQAALALLPPVSVGSEPTVLPVVEGKGRKKQRKRRA